MEQLRHLLGFVRVAIPILIVICLVGMQRGVPRETLAPFIWTLIALLLSGWVLAVATGEASS